jgi:hypothetical protein
MKQQTTRKPAAPFLHPNANVSLKEQIAQRAHELWLYRGHKNGNDLADGFQAEHEINEWHQYLARPSPASAHTSL